MSYFLWEYLSSGVNPENFVLAYEKTEDGVFNVSLWVNLTQQYQSMAVTFFVSSDYFNRLNNNVWIYFNHPNPVSEIPSEYTQIPSKLMHLQNPIPRYEEAISNLRTQVLALETQFKQHSWQEVQHIVRAGLAEDVFTLGYEFTTPDSDTGIDIVWRVVAHNHHKAANENLKHTMTLEMKNVYSGSNGSAIGVQFDATEAVYYAEEGLEAGVYNFTVANRAHYAEDNGKIFQFTLTKAVPAGGQIVLVNVVANATLLGKTVNTFASPSSTDIIETATLIEGNGGRNLGTTDGKNNMNHFQRAAFGSDNYSQSALRQWLNSAAAAGDLWAPTNKFDRPPTWKATHNGFLHGLPAEFLEVVQPAVIPCRTNSTFEVDSLDGTVFAINQVYNLEDKFFVASRSEIYGTWDNANLKDGELLAYYNNVSNAERIKYDEVGLARVIWLRTVVPTYAYHVRLTNASGLLSGQGANATPPVIPFCILA